MWKPKAMVLGLFQEPEKVVGETLLSVEPEVERRDQNPREAGERTHSVAAPVSTGLFIDASQALLRRPLSGYHYVSYANEVQVPALAQGAQPGRGTPKPLLVVQ